MRNISDKICKENQNTFYAQVTPPLPPNPEYYAIYEIMVKKYGTVRQATDGKTV